MHENTMQESRVPSTRASTAFHLRDRVLVFTSEWWFYPEGIVDVKERFELICKENAIVPVPGVGWASDKQQFVMLCSPVYVESVQAAFMQATRELIRDEEMKNGIVGQRCLPKQHLGMDSDSDSSDSGFDSDSGSDGGDGHILDGAADKIPFISNKIQRLEDYLALRGHRVAPSGRLDEDVEYPPELIRLKYKEIWYCQHQLDKILPGSTLQRLTSVTGCTMVKSVADSRVYLGACSEETVHLAILKLENLAKYAQLTSLLSHIVYTEETGSFELSLMLLNEVKIKNKRMSETTLLDAVDCLIDPANDYGSLYRFLTIRCATHVPNRATFATVKIKATVNDRPDFDEERPVWSHFHFASKAGTGDPMRHLAADKRIIPPQKRSESLTCTPTPAMPTPDVIAQVHGIEKWKQEAKAENASGFNTPEKGEVTLNLVPSWDHSRRSENPCYDHAKPQVSWEPKTITGLFSKAKVTPYSVVHTPSSRIATETVISAPGPLTMAPTMAQKLKVTASGVNIMSDSWPKAGENSRAQTNPNQIFRRGRPAASNATPPPPTSLAVNTKQTAVRPEAQSREAVQPFISEPQDSDNNKSLLDLDDEDCTIAIEPMAFTTSYSGSLDKLQTSSEMATRKYHNTMSQKKQKSNRKAINTSSNRLERPDNHTLAKPTATQPRRPIDPQPGFVCEVKENFLDLLQDICGFRGKLTLEVQFGRILVKGVKLEYVATNDNKDFCLPEDALKRILQPQYAEARPPTTSFTQNLTTVPAEATHLTLANNCFSGINLWDLTYYDWDAFYTFTYIDNATELMFRIEINAETFMTDVKIPRDLGNIYVHGTKRAWDFRISLSGAELDENLHERYAALAAMLQKTLYIPSGLTHPELYAEVNSTINSQFSLVDIRIHKVNLHRSRDKKSVLKLTEVLVLNTFIRSNKAKDVFVIRARYHDPEVPDLHENCRWFTAAIQSVEANKILSQNDNLGLGDAAAWSPETFERANVVDDLYLPALEMLKSMDGIGYHNKNGRVAACIATVPPPVPSPISFW